MNYYVVTKFMTLIEYDKDRLFPLANDKKQFFLRLNEVNSKYFYRRLKEIIESIGLRL